LNPFEQPSWLFTTRHSLYLASVGWDFQGLDDLPESGEPSVAATLIGAKHLVRDFIRVVAIAEINEQTPNLIFAQVTVLVLVEWGKD
jgi:hypothetical protein